MRDPRRIRLAVAAAALGGSLVVFLYHGDALAEGNISLLRLLQIVATYAVLYGFSSWVLRKHSH